MPEQPIDETTRLTTAMGDGDADSATRLFPLLYEELRRMAAKLFSGQPAGHTLQPTALVHEAFLKMVKPSTSRLQDRAHFLALAARAMRQVLVNHALGRGAKKRGGDHRRVPLAVADPNRIGVAGGIDDIDLIALHEALEELAALDERKSRVTEMRFFGGLTNDEISEVLAVSTTTVESDWRLARAWLSRALAEGERE